MDLEPFRNEALLDLGDPRVQGRYDAAIAAVRSRLGASHALIVDSKRIETRDSFVSIDPSRRDAIVGRFAMAGAEHVELAIAAASRAFESWRDTPAARRAEWLLRAARILRERKLELAAWMIFEVGKNRREADADVAEAIDFCEFYAREALRLDGPQPVVQNPGELDELFYVPLGVAVVVPPWNFPLAITCGMTAAAIVTGNTVVLKPASDAPAIAFRLVEILEEAGLPPGVLNLLTGPGGTIGDLLVDHPRTRLVAFTGSKEVGLRINERAARHQPGQRWIKRVICEMGGKDAIIVDRDADLDAAADGVVASAFGYQGQKCSACSRAIVDEAVYSPFLARLEERVVRLVTGPAEDPRSDLGPVINARAQAKILEYVAVGRGEGRLLCGGGAGEPGGFFVTPTVFTDVAPRARIAQEEIFGPVLAVIRARDFDHALAIANDSEYGLTGAVYSADRDKLERAKRRFHVGNLYLNRKCTGALVGCHPFGGFNLSGTDSKAGGRDYLPLFLQAKSIAEKLK